MEEGDDLKITLKTKNADRNNRNICSYNEDFVDLSPLNTFTVNETGEVSIDVTAIEDFQIEGIETLTISLTSSSYGDTEWEGIVICYYSRYICTDTITNTYSSTNPTTF